MYLLPFVHLFPEQGEEESRGITLTNYPGLPKGNDYRLVVKMHYERERVYVCSLCWHSCRVRQDRCGNNLGNSAKVTHHEEKARRVRV